MSEEPAARPKESPPAPRAAPREVWKKGGRLLSVLLAVNVLLLACTLISGGAFNKVAVYDTDVFALLTAMMLLATLWILFYLLRTVRRPDAVPYRDKHAGPIWLRGAVQSGRRGGGGLSQGAGGRGRRGGLEGTVASRRGRGRSSPGGARGGRRTGRLQLEKRKGEGPGAGMKANSLPRLKMGKRWLWEKVSAEEQKM